MKLKKIYSNIIPFEGYLAVTIWPFVFIRKELAHKFTPAAERHSWIPAVRVLMGILLHYILS